MADEIISGGRELDAFLQSLPAKVEKNIMRAALRAGANQFKAEVKANVPVDDGDLRDSVRVSTRSKRGTVYASLKVGNKKAWYAHFVEYGTKPHIIKAKNGGTLHIGSSFLRQVMHPGAKPNPFIRPAFDSKSSEAIAAVAAKVRERLTKEGLNVPAPEGE